MPSTNEQSSFNWRVSCDGCYLDEKFPFEEHANKMKVYHDAVFDCEGEAYKEEL